MTPQCPAPITREDIMTVSDVASLLGLSTYTVKEYARRQLLPGANLAELAVLPPGARTSDQAASPA